jgi:DNA mismatch repair protein MutL
MSKDDLALSIKRHTTSKIKTSEDLERIMTFGFRGEALASISSVSDLEIRTKRKEDSIGWKLQSEPLKAPLIEPFNLEKGTQVYVRNLFYNVPARKKFLKPKLSEVRIISDTLIKLALANIDKRITYYNEDTLIFDLHPGTLIDRISTLLHKPNKETLFPVDYSNELVHITGYIGHPSISQMTLSGQYLFVNRRPIESRNLSFAIFSAYEHLLDKKQKPIFVINLQLNPERIDVNIHPQKNEVKFDNENYVYNSLRKAVNLTLQNNNLMTEIEINNNLINNPFLTLNNEKNNEILLVNQVTGEIISPDNIDRNKLNFSSNRNFETKNWNFPQSFNYQNSPVHQDNINLLFNNDSSKLSFNEVPNSLSELNSNVKKSIEEISKDLEFANYFQVHNKYIIVTISDGIIIVDQHNAHERVIFERVHKNFSLLLSNNQELIFPLELTLKITYISLLQELKEEIELLGFKFDVLSPTQIKLYTIPKDVKLGKEEFVLTSLLDDYLNNLEIKNSPKREKIIATYSCKSAIKTGEKLTTDKMKQLVIDLFKCKTPYVCPHGRPIVLEMSLSDLDKQFGRTS